MLSFPTHATSLRAYLPYLHSKGKILSAVLTHLVLSHSHESHEHASLLSPVTYSRQTTLFFSNVGMVSGRSGRKIYTLNSRKAFTAYVLNTNVFFFFTLQLSYRLKWLWPRSANKLIMDNRNGSVIEFSTSGSGFSL